MSGDGGQTSFDTTVHVEKIRYFVFRHVETFDTVSTRIEHFDTLFH